MSEMAVEQENSRINGSTSASASARRSRTICVNSLRACEKMRLIGGTLPPLVARLLSRPQACQHCPAGETHKKRWSAHASYCLPRQIYPPVGPSPPRDEHVFEQSFLRACRARPRRHRAAVPRLLSSDSRRCTITCRRSPNSETRQRSICSFSRSAARCGWSTTNSSRWPPWRALDAAGRCPRRPVLRHHEAQPVALFGFFQIVRGHQDGGAHVGQPVDHAPEGAARQRIHAGGRFIQKQHAAVRA